MADEEDSEATYTPEEALGEAWWEALDMLRETMLMSESTSSRVDAADTILRYTAALSTGINAPWMPKARPVEEDDDE